MAELKYRLIVNTAGWQDRWNNDTPAAEIQDALGGSEYEIDVIDVIERSNEGTMVEYDLTIRGDQAEKVRLGVIVFDLLRRRFTSVEVA